MLLPVIGEFTLASLVAFIIGLVVIWIIVTIPVYIIAKFFMPKASLRDALVATIFGPLVYVVTLFAADYLLAAVIGILGYILALAFAFIAWVWIFKISFRTGWLRGLVIALLAIVVFAFLSYVFGFFLGLMVPTPFFPKY